MIDAPTPSQSTQRGKALALTGALLQLGPLIGAAGTAVGMMHAFQTLGSGPGISDPQQMSASIGEVLIATAVGFGFSMIGLVLVCIALFGCRYRAEWFFWFLVIYGGILLAGFPIGTGVGIVFLVFCIVRREEFLNPNRPGNV